MESCKNTIKILAANLVAISDQLFVLELTSVVQQFSRGVTRNKGVTKNKQMELMLVAAKTIYGALAIIC